MKNQGFYWEIKDILTQFVAAFDDCVIKRYDKNRNARETIEVRYVMAPKERVLYDIVNKAQNLTLPAVAINITGITRDQSRVFNKIEPSYLPGLPDEYGHARSAKIYTPIPINIEVSFSIITKYMADMDQIISNFVPYSNPYIILSWPVPSDFGLAQTTEIRSEVLWGGSLSYTSPTDITFSDKYRVAVDTSFTIKTWLYREVVDPSAIIYKVDANFINVRSSDILYSTDDYSALSGYSNTDVVTVSAIPSFTNLFFATTGATIPIFDNISIRKSNPSIFVAYGRSFDYNNTFYLSSNDISFLANPTAIVTAKSPTITAFDVSSYASTLNNNIFTLNFPTSTFTKTGIFTIVTANSAGWGSFDGYVQVLD